MPRTDAQIGNLAFALFDCLSKVDLTYEELKSLGESIYAKAEITRVSNGAVKKLWLAAKALDVKFPLPEPAAPAPAVAAPEPVVAVVPQAAPAAGTTTLSTEPAPMPTPTPTPVTPAPTNGVVVQPEIVSTSRDSAGYPVKADAS